MNFIRKRVSGNKNRHKEFGLDLDLSYITPRIVAMAIPGEGLNSFFRNDIDDIREFLRTKHKNKYMIINLSGEKYNYDLFDNRVYEYDWIDHQAPTIHTLFLICKRIYDYLSINTDNVAIINCKAGKGRTGTVICCFLLFAGLFNDVDFALEYYAIKRFKCGEGVTQPSQKRYIYFFNEILKGKIYYPSRVVLEGIYAKNLPNLNESNHIKPFFTISLDNSEFINFSNKKSNKEQKKVFIINDKEIHINEDLCNDITIAGDFTMSLYNNQKMGDKLIGRIAYNTAFFENDEKVLEFSINEIDPDNLVKNKEYSKDFKIYVSCYIWLYMYYYIMVIWLHY